MLTREQVEKVLDDLHDNSCGISVRRAAHQQLYDTDAALRARITHLETALQRSSDDNLEYLTCQPGCNSYGHDEHCAVANPRLEFDRLRAELAVYDAVAVDRDGTPFAAASAWRAECNRLRAENERLTKAATELADLKLALWCPLALSCFLCGKGPLLEKDLAVRWRDSLLGICFECRDLRAQVEALTRERDAVEKELAKYLTGDYTGQPVDAIRQLAQIMITAKDNSREAMAQLTASQARVVELEEAAEQALNECLGRYDGVPDSTTKWMGLLIQQLQQALTKEGM